MSRALEERTSFVADIHREILDPKKKPKSRGISDATFEKLREEAVECAQRNDWTLATPRHFVAHFAHLHQKVYGLPLTELTPKKREGASFVVKKLLDGEFGGDKSKLAAFARWAWNREASRHEWRKANARELTRARIGLFFSAAFVTDWRLATGGKS